MAAQQQKEQPVHLALFFGCCTDFLSFPSPRVRLDSIIRQAESAPKRAKTGAGSLFNHW
jgi:hypothetical protein